jgi:putative ABC transport system permease protein
MRDGAPVVMMSASLAQKLWPGESPLGRRIRPVIADAEPGPWLQVIGTVGDVEPLETMIASSRPARLQLYLPWTANPAGRLSLVVHARAPLDGVADRVRDTLRQVDPAVSVIETLTMSDAVDRDSWTSRIFSEILGLYASIAVAIALVGVYGLAADAVSGRTHELAVRLALGARRSQVIAMVMRWGLTLGAAGIATGILLAFAVTRFGSAMLPGISAQDPAVFAGVATLVAVVTLLAVWLPARGISRIEPADALRSD